MHKVHIFYLRDSIIDPDSYIAVISDMIKGEDGKQVYMYAFTDNKKYAKEFRRTRDMSKFVEKIYTMNDDVYRDFTSLYSDIDYYPQTIWTQKEIDGKNIGLTVNIGMTVIEYEQLTTFGENWIANLLTIPEDIVEFIDKVGFKNPYKKILNSVFFLDSYIADSIYPTEYVFDAEVRIDELELFVKLFSNVIKKDNKK